LNPGRYVGVAEGKKDDFDFLEKLEELNEEFEILSSEATELEDIIKTNLTQILSITP
jgi:type I restriction enzyme M protein